MQAPFAAGASIATITSSLQQTCVKGTCYRPLASPSPQIRFSCITRANEAGEWLDLLKTLILSELRP